MILIFYPELWAITGDSVPDYRGLFLRHVGGNSAELDVKQGDAIRNIWGQFQMPVYYSNDSGVYMNGTGWGVFYTTGRELGYYPPKVATNGTYPSTHMKNVVIFDTSKIGPVASENRPVNKAIKYLIRASN